MGTRVRTCAFVLFLFAAAAAGDPLSAGESSWNATITEQSPAAAVPARPDSPAPKLKESRTEGPAGAPVDEGQTAHASPAVPMPDQFNEDQDASQLETEPDDSIETGAIGSKTSKYVLAESVTLGGTASRTSFRLGLSAGVTAEVFTLANPFRVVVDLPDVAFRLDEGAGRTGKGVISAFRYGLFASGKGRMVLDLTGPARIEKADMVALGDGRRVELKIDIVPIPAQQFGSGTGARRQAAAAKKHNPEKPEATRTSRREGQKPVIVIDPGHGGVDPGAVGATHVLEKSVALGVALQLKRALAATGRYAVRMTRSTDVFVSLDRRLQYGREVNADLFVSLHADSLEDPLMSQFIRGATVYTLSERASDEQARRMAEKENASDLFAGLDAKESDDSQQVKSILIDLMKRETSNFSAEFSKLLVGKLARAGPLSRDAQRSAAFKVLKQTHAPAVLVELGYMSNVEDEKRLTSAAWRKNVALQMRLAIDAYFARQTARAK